MNRTEPLKDSEIKPGMLVRCGDTGSDTEWEVLDRAPKPGQWWLHRWDENGEWQTTCSHRYSMAIVGEGSRAEHQLASV